jgi:hypothetical protein
MKVGVVDAQWIVHKSLPSLGAQVKLIAFNKSNLSPQVTLKSIIVYWHVLIVSYQLRIKINHLKNFKLALVNWFGHQTS